MLFRRKNGNGIEKGKNLKERERKRKDERKWK
jgi:hypothetical protein